MDSVDISVPLPLYAALVCLSAFAGFGTMAGTVGVPEPYTYLIGGIAGLVVTYLVYDTLKVATADSEPSYS